MTYRVYSGPRGSEAISPLALSVSDDTVYRTLKDLRYGQRHVRDGAARARPGGQALPAERAGRAEPR
jgi:hypothetical protein